MSVQMQAAKRRIRSITATEKITSAMEMVAVTKLKVWEYRLLQNQQYRNMIEKILEDLLQGVNAEDSRFLMAPAEATRTFHVVFASDMGLCGSYNNAILSYANEKIHSQDTVLTIGKRSLRFFLRRDDIKLENQFVEAGSNIKMSTVLPLERTLETAFFSGNYREIVIHFNQYINSFETRPTSFTLFPLGGLNSLQAKPVIEPIGPIIEPDKKNFIDRFVPLYLQNVIYFTLMSAQVSEQSTRRMAMKQATDNANELLDDLNIRYNMARQAAITQEISELVSGSL